MPETCRRRPLALEIFGITLTSSPGDWRRTRNQLPRLGGLPAPEGNVVFELINVMLVAVLVGITAYYAKQTRRSVEVMEESVRAAQRPYLAMQVCWVGDTYAGVRVSNVGRGPALDADLKVTYVPRKTSHRDTEHRCWRLGLMEPGRRMFVEGPTGTGGEMVNRETLCADYERVSLTGSVRDSLGEVHGVDLHLMDLRDFHDLERAGVDLQDDRIERSLGRIARSVSQLSYGVERLAPSRGGECDVNLDRRPMMEEDSSEYVFEPPFDDARF